MIVRLLLALALTLSAAQAVDFSSLESIPIQEGGRKKPYLVFAQETLLGLSGKSALEFDGTKRSALEIVTRLWIEPEGWQKKPMILVSNGEFKKATGLEASRKLFSYEELAANMAFLQFLQDAQTTRARPGNVRLSGLPKEAADVGARMADLENLGKGTAFRFIANTQAADAAWQAAPAPAALRDALAKNDSEAFAREVAALKSQWSQVAPQFQPPAWKVSLETAYQKTHPFRWAWIFYAAAGFVLFFAWQRGYAAAWVLALIGLAFQVAGFTARVLIAGRAPVTNMYESIIWVAFGAILFALIFEAIYRGRYFLMGAVPVAVASLILADTQTVALNRAIDPLVPVLRDNFWLTTHVLTITLSYAAFVLALGLGHIALGLVILGRKQNATLYTFIYRTLQIGVLLLAIGTILGGVWANYSWGRFWDWDPKETWALITLLGYLFLLHGRVAGRWAGFGLAVGAILGFLSVLMAWYGVNFVLGVGLHSYGFGSGGFGYALAFVAVEVAFVALGLYRYQATRSRTPAPEEKELAETR